MLTFSVSKFLRPNHPDSEKLSTYECGEEAEGTGQIQFNSRFFIIALIFVLFEVEMIFFFPWTIVANSSSFHQETNTTWGILALTEMLVFVFILGIGLAYAWAKGHLNWIKPETVPSKLDYKIPMSAYEKLDHKATEAT